MRSNEQTKRIVIVGAGIAGLTAAVALAARGCAVTVVERAEKAGGKLRQVPVGGVPIDSGPTVFTMRWVFDELFDEAGTALEDHIRLHTVDIFARHAWGASERLDLFADIERSADAIGAFAGPREARGYLAFCDRARLIYETLERSFIRAQRPSNPMTLMARAGTRDFANMFRINPYSTMWQQVSRYFRDPRLRQLFGRYTTYCGSSPFQAPGTLMLIAHVERAGVYLIEGGMYRLIEALTGLAERLGVRFHYGAHVDEIRVRNGRTSGVHIAGGDAIEADAVVVNADAAALAAGLFGAAARRAVGPIPAARRSLSALTWSINARTAGFPLLRHNVFFSPDFREEFRAIFGRGTPPDVPSVYVCAQDRDDRDTPSRDGPERLFCIVNAPARGDTHPLEPSEIEQCEHRTFALLQRLGLQVERTSDTSHITTPSHFETMFPGTGGGLYGQAAHGWLAAFRRPKAKTRIPGLYLAGGSVHPGPGIAMAAQSGRLAAQRLIADLVSTSR